MGRGSSKAGGVGPVKEITVAGGTKIDLSDSPLQYGSLDPYVTGVVREKVEAWEERRVKNKIEYNMSVDENGYQIGPEVKGGKRSVKVPLAQLDKGATHTHIHPRDTADILGGTFSDGDMRNFARNGVKTYRAKAKEGAYSISKTDKFDKLGFMDYVKKEYARHDAFFANTRSQLDNKIRTDKSYSYSSYLKDWNKGFNAMLVAMHNTLLSGQKQYGYKYTLEKGGN